MPEVARPPPAGSQGEGTSHLRHSAPQYKITPEVIATWSCILREAPASRLVLKNVALASEDNRRFVLDQFAHCQVSPARIELSGPAEHFAFLEQYAAIDLALDIVSSANGGTTTMEAFSGRACRCSLSAVGIR